MLTYTLAITLLTAIPQDADILVERCDLIELNHFTDHQHNRVFDQIIFYEWKWKESRHEIIAWRMLKSNSQIPRKNWVGGGWVANWRDSQGGDVDRCVMANSYRVTYTTHDPEVENRDVLPVDKRRGLLMPKAKGK